MLYMEDNRLRSWLEESRWLECPMSASAPPYSSSSARIFRVPDILIINDPMVYSSKVMSLGPFHFLRPDLDGGERLKAKIIAEAVLSRLPPDFFIPLLNIRQAGPCLGHMTGLLMVTALSEDNFFTKVLGARKEAYGNEPAVTRLTDEMFVFMMFRDASFLLRVLIESFGHGFADIVYPVVGPALFAEIWTDTIKLENQVPLSALEALYPFLEPGKSFKDFVISICQRYSIFWPREKSALANSQLFNKDHLLHCLYEMSVFAEPKGLPRKSWYQRWSPFARMRTRSLGYFSSNWCQRWSPLAWMRTHSLCCFSSAWYQRWSPFAWIRTHSLGCFSFRNRDPDADLDLVPRVVASAMELSKAGVKFRPFTGGIKHLRFDETTCTLYLPRLMIVRDYTMVVLKNMMAFEWGSPAYEKKIVTSLLCFLDELIDTHKDLELFKRNGIIVIWGSHDVDAFGLLKSLTVKTWMRRYLPIMTATIKMNKIYKKRKWKILWSEFLEAYFSKPWVFVSAVAATLLLGMTVVQVVCLFYTCTRKA